ncbi:MAG: CBS domain-containing protein [Cyanobacteriota bacterium]|nr:CBS domain-containing protein [Cyanobacteriota bacterium]
MAKTVGDLMSKELILATPEMPLKEAIQVLAERRISGLPVVDKAGKLVGIISETDLMWQETGVAPPRYITFLDSIIFLENPARYKKEIHKALGTTVGEVMTEGPVTTKATESLEAAGRLMHDKDVHRLPVLGPDGQVVGILTRGDIIRAMASDS